MLTTRDDRIRDGSGRPLDREGDAHGVGRDRFRGAIHTGAREPGYVWHFDIDDNVGVGTTANSIVASAEPDVSVTCSSESPRTEQAAGGVLTAQKAPHQPGTGQASGLSAGGVVTRTVDQVAFPNNSGKGGCHDIGGSRGRAPES
jgi:hypothetical protein